MDCQRMDYCHGNNGNLQNDDCNDRIHPLRIHTSTSTYTSTSTFFGFLAGSGSDLEQGGNGGMEQMTEQEQLEHAIRMSEQEQIDQAKRLSLQSLFN